MAFLLYKMTFFASRQFLFFRPDTSSRSFSMQNRMIETPGAKIRENFGKSKRPTLAPFTPPPQLQEIPRIKVIGHVWMDPKVRANAPAQAQARAACLWPGLRVNQTYLEAAWRRRRRGWGENVAYAYTHETLAYLPLFSPPPRTPSSLFPYRTTHPLGSLSSRSEKRLRLCVCRNERRSSAEFRPSADQNRFKSWMR